MIATATSINLKVLLEGVEIPTTRVVVSYGVKTPAQAQIIIPFAKSAFNLLPRTLAHVFFRLGPEDENYRLLFAGELISVSTSVEPHSRSTVLTCVDHYNYLSIVHRFFFDPLGLDPTFRRRQIFMGAKPQKASILAGAAGTLRKLLLKSCRGYPNTKGLLSGILSIIEAVTGISDGEKENYRGINEYFELAQHRLRIYNQIGAPPNDRTSAKLLDRKEFSTWLKALLRRGGNSYRLSDLIDVLLELIFYHRISNPAARYLKDPTELGVKFKHWLPTTIMLPDLIAAPPPVCNVFFPDILLRYGYARNFLSEPTRYLVVTPRYILNADNVQEGRIGSVNIFAPNVETLTGESAQTASQKFRHVFLPHEIYTGIIPSMEWFSDIKQYDPLLGWLGKSIGAEIQKELKTEQKKLRGAADDIPYLQRVANYKFARSRLASRILTVISVFNPFVVPGLPALLFDKRPEITKGEKPRDRYNVFMGTPIEITHVLSPSDAITHIKLIYARTLEEQEAMFEGLHSMPTSVSSKAKNSNAVIAAFHRAWRTTDYSLWSESLTIDTQPKSNYDKKYPADEYISPDAFLSYIKKARFADRYEKKLAADLYSLVSKVVSVRRQAAAEPGSNLEGLRLKLVQLESQILGILQRLVPRMSAQITRRIVVDGKAVNVAFEDAIRTFLSPIYLNENIGREVYKPLFGVDSLVDRLRKQNPDSYKISEAVDWLLEHYETNRESLSDFWYRPIASLDDILGEDGFHSRALGEVSQEMLEKVKTYKGGLFETEVEALKGFPKESNIPELLKQHDPRPNYRERVLELRLELDAISA